MSVSTGIGSTSWRWAPHCGQKTPPSWTPKKFSVGSSGRSQATQRKSCGCEAGQAQQLQIEPAQQLRPNCAGAHCPRLLVDRTQDEERQLPDRLALIAAFHETVEQLPDVAGGGDPVQALAQIAEGLDRRHLRDDVPGARLRHQERDVHERLQMAGLAAARLAYALGDELQLASARRQHGHHPVGVVHVAPAQQQGMGRVDPFAGRHGRGPENRKVP